MDLANLNINQDKNKYRRRPTVDLSTMVFGKVPPQAKELEMAVLGGIMNERRALAEVQDLLTDGKFYMEAHQRIYRAMLSLDARNKPIDLLTVVEQLKSTQELEMVGGAYYLAEVTKAVVSAANIQEHAGIVVQKWMAREVIRVGGEMVANGYEDGMDPFDMLDEAEAGLTAIMNSNDRGRIVSADAAVAEALTHLAHRRNLDSSLTGIPSGWAPLDNLTHGWQDTDLIILAARPAVGKTAFALNLALNAVISSKPVPTAFFSLEMSTNQLVQRIISAESEVFMESIMTGRISDEQERHIHKCAARIAAAPLFIDDTPALNVFEIRAKARRLKNKHDLGFIIIDYLQLMSGVEAKKGGNREQEISQISRSLKGLAKELQVPIIALSQLSRAVESRTEKMPQLSDLRESGAIEQDADMVMFLYRPEYYGIEANENGQSTKGETHVRIAKHRSGTLDTVKFTARLHIQKFVEFEGEGFISAPPSNFRPVKTFYETDKDDTPF